MSARPVAPARLLIAVALLIGVLAVSVAGYVRVEHWSWFDALYMTITTVTTLGGGEPQPLSYAGRWLTLGVIVFGAGATTYAFLALAGFLLDGQLGSAFGKRRARARVQSMTGHFILCGFGRVGREIAHEFVVEKVPFVVVDINPSSLDLAQREGHPTVAGSATEVEVLREAGIERARGLITATDDDATNVFVTLSARVLRADLLIVARANREDSEVKLRFAGANRVISPYYIGGKRMASFALRPTAADFVDTILEAGNTNLLLEDLQIPERSRWIGQSLGAFAARSREAIILALKRNNVVTFRPAESTLLEAGDEVIAAGPRDEIRKLEDMG
jgi:voltage-gated potassium channel